MSENPPNEERDVAPAGEEPNPSAGDFPETVPPPTAPPETRPPGVSTSKGGSVPEQFGRYKILKLLGKGGMGAVPRQVFRQQSLAPL